MVLVLLMGIGVMGGGSMVFLCLFWKRRLSRSCIIRDLLILLYILRSMI